jgi:hypothetical protein
VPVVGSRLSRVGRVLEPYVEAHRLDAGSGGCPEAPVTAAPTA